jgi:hypothetical protein
MIDHYTPADRLGTSLAAKRAAAIAYLRQRNKYLLDEDCNFLPTCAKATDVRQTIKDARKEMSGERFMLGFQRKGIAKWQ